METSELYTHLSEVFRSAQEDSTRDEVHEDLVNDMWSEYLKDVEDYDTRVTDAWKDDANGVLVFTGLFSATVASFIIASYPMLSQDSGSQTVFLLGQVSQQLAGLANGTYIPPQTYPSSPPSSSIICVNAMWLLSLVLSTTSALFATLMQQWARRYVQLPQIRSAPRERARVRSFVFIGTVKYAMHRAAETAPTLLHVSVFLFYVGLVIFFFTIFKLVAIITLLFVGLFGMAYLMLTIIPCLDHNCPYRTPMSSIWWYLWHTLLSFATYCLRCLLKTLHGVLIRNSAAPGDITTDMQGKLVEWLDASKEILNGHAERLKDGFRESIVKAALSAPHSIDVKALTWLFQLPALSEKSKIQNFMASIPGETVVQLLSTPLERGKITFRDHLSTLLRSCAPGTVGLEEDMRHRRLLVCLGVVHHIAKALVVPHPVSLPPSLLNDVRMNFANLDFIRTVWADRDPAVRVTARSICALLARRLLRKFPLEASELAWLEDVMGLPSNTIYNALGDLSTVDNMNIDSFVYGVLSKQTDDLPILPATAFAETLVILTKAGSQAVLRRDTFEEQLSLLILRVEQGSHEDRNNVVVRLRNMFGGFLASNATTTNT
ncbi:hypothetical protein BJV74DRAFT_794417 [Russula compacta]|nr:hypothetical protein BJV74DRAFT_794417 [Russula compacta]